MPPRTPVTGGFLVVERAGAFMTVATEAQLAAFLGPIDTLAEAALVARVREAANVVDEHAPLGCIRCAIPPESTSTPPWHVHCERLRMQWYRLALVTWPWLVACQTVEFPGSEPTEKGLPAVPLCPQSPPSALERGKWVKVLDNGVGSYRSDPVCIVGPD